MTASSYITPLHKHDTVQSEVCLVITDVVGGSHNFCIAWAEEILDRAQDDPNALRAELGL